MPETFFISGTDTDVGKTLVTAALLCALARRGGSSTAIKPLAAGGEITDCGLRNADGLILQRYQTAVLSYQEVNPVLLPEPLSPHIAARRSGRRVSIAQLEGYCRAAMMQAVDMVLVEGAGGWRVPINQRENLSALPVQLKLPVILVVGLKLGCLNHALLTAEAIVRDGLPLVAWVANQIDPAMDAVDANIDTLRERLPGHFLGYVPWLNEPTPERIADCLDLSGLLAKRPQ